MHGEDVGDLSVYLEFDNKIPTTPLWSKVGGDEEGDWKNMQINVRLTLHWKFIHYIEYNVIKLFYKVI